MLKYEGEGKREAIHVIEPTERKYRWKRTKAQKITGVREYGSTKRLRLDRPFFFIC